MISRTGSAIALVLCLLAWTAIGARQPDAVAVQLLAFNDFHGHLEPPSGSNGVLESITAGGAEYLATHLAALEARNRNTLIVSAGDMIGASPLLSGMFHDEPAVEALNAMGLDVSTVGNHEFDEGWRELVRMQNGGCHPIDGCQDGTPFAGAAFQYLAANVAGSERLLGRPGPLLPAYIVKEIAGVRIGFIGLALARTPELVLASGVAGLTFHEEVATANRLVRELRKQNVRAIVVLIHQGGYPAANEYNGCRGVSGPIREMAHRLSNDVGVIVSGHSHRAYNCLMDGKLVTSAASFGRVITAIDLTIDPRRGTILAKTAQNVIVTRDVARDPAQTAIIEHYKPFYSTAAHRVIGTIAGDLTRIPNVAGESPLGDVIADAVLEAARGESARGVAMAFMNPDGIRADLFHPTAPDSAPREVSYAEGASVLPFGNNVVVVTMTGEMIKDVLEQQFDNPDPGQDRMLQVSDGFSYSYDRTAPRPRRVVPGSIRIDGRPIAPDGRYRVALNEFIASGGDNFGVFTRAREPETIGLDLDMLTAYFRRNSPVRPGPVNRITRIR